MNISNNKPLEVTKDQYDHLRVDLAGLIMHKKKDKKYFVMPVLNEGVKRLKEYFDEPYR